MNKKVRLTEQQHETIINEILKETINELTELENKGKLNEGFWSVIKYALSKLGRYKADGKIFGKGRIDLEYTNRIKNIIEKEGNEMIHDLDKKIREINPEFPNNKDQQEFLSVVLSISAVYDSIVSATQKNPKEDGYMPIDAANGVINDLREYIRKFLDVDLKAVYTGLDEKLDAEKIRQDFNSKKGENEFNSTRMNTLKSNKLPLILAGIGASLGSLGWMVQTDWFKSWIESIMGSDKIITNTKEVINNITGGEPDSNGFVSWASKIMGEELKTGSNIQEFINKFGAENVSHMFDGNGAGDSMSQVNKLQEIINSNPNATVGEIFNKADQTFGDMKSGGNLFGVSKSASFFANVVTKQVSKTLVKGTGTALAGTLAGLGPIVAGIGIGLVTTGALVKAFRVKGQKSSRAATLNSLYQSIRNLDGGLGLFQSDEKKDEKENDVLYNSLKNLFQFIVNNKKNIGSGKYDTSNRGNSGDRFYQGGQIMKGGKRAAKKGGETQSGRERFFNNQTNVREDINEGKYITNKDVLSYLSKKMPFDKIKNFENLINRVEYIVGVIKKIGENTEDKVLNNFMKEFYRNPIMNTDFKEIFNVNPSKPQEVNSLLGNIKEILNNVYSKEYKFGVNMVDKMASLGGNINKLEEDENYNMRNPNKSFRNDSISKSSFKNNLLKFLETAISLFNYLHKSKQRTNESITRKIKITSEQYNKIILSEKNNRLNEMVSTINEVSGVILNEGMKEVLLGVASLMGVNLSGQNKELADKTLSDKASLIEIKKVLEDEVKIKDLVKSFVDKGMQNVELKLAKNAEKITKTYNKISKDNNIGQILSDKAIMNLVSLDKNLAKEYEDKRNLEVSGTTSLEYSTIIKDVIDFKISTETLFDNGSVKLSSNGDKILVKTLNTIKEKGGEISSINIELSSDSEPIQDFINDYDKTGNITLLSLRSKSIIKFLKSFDKDIIITSREIPNNGLDIVTPKEFSSSDEEEIKLLKEKTFEFNYIKLKMNVVYTNKNLKDEKPEEMVKNNRTELLNSIGKKNILNINIEPISPNNKIKCKTKVSQTMVLKTCTTFNG